MLHLLRIENTKNLQNNSFKIILLLHLSLFSLFIFLGTKFQFSVPGFSTRKFFMFPHVWQSFSYMAGWFNIFFVSLLGIIITGNEFTFKTFKQQLINGLSRNELWIQKLISFFILSLYSTLITIVSSLVYGSIFTPEFGFTEIFSGIQHSLLLLLQCYAYLCLGFLFVILVKSPAYSIFLFFAYWIAIEPIFRAFFSPELRQYFPMKVFGNLTKLPEVVSLSSEKELLNPDGSSALSLNQFGFENVDLSTGLNLALSVMYLAIIIFSIKFIFDKKSF